MASYNDLFARPACWIVTRKGKDIAQVHKHGNEYAVVLGGNLLPSTYETLEVALRAIDRRI